MTDLAVDGAGVEQDVQQGVVHKAPHLGYRAQREGLQPDH